MAIAIRYTRLALANLEDARHYIAKENPSAARRIAATIQRAIAELGQFPELGRPGRVLSTRELVIAGTPFVVVYRYAEHTVQILAILHERQAWPL